MEHRLETYIDNDVLVMCRGGGGGDKRAVSGEWTRSVELVPHGQDERAETATGGAGWATATRRTGMVR